MNKTHCSMDLPKLIKSNVCAVSIIVHFIYYNYYNIIIRTIGKYHSSKSQKKLLIKCFLKTDQKKNYFFFEQHLAT